MRIKFFYCLALALFLFFPNLEAETLEAHQIDVDKFQTDIKGALLSEDPETIIKKCSPYLAEAKSLNVPNCFGCSLFLIKASENSLPEVQLVAADLAVKFSNDLPEAHYHYLSRLLRHDPFQFKRIFNGLVDLIKKSASSASKDSAIYLFLSNLARVCFIFFFLILLLMVFKYPDVIFHKYMHLVGFSKFYAITLAFTNLLFLWILFKNFQNIALIILLLLVFFGSIGNLQEKATLYIVSLLLLLSMCGIIFTGNDKTPKYDRDAAFNHLISIYSPSSAPRENINLSQPGGYMAKGFTFLFLQNYNRASFYLKKELERVKNGEIRTSLKNALGISAAAVGKYQESINFFKESYRESKDINIAYNLRKVLYEAGLSEEAKELEKNMAKYNASSAIPYPYVVFPATSVAWKYFCYGNSFSNFSNFIASLIFLLGNLIFYILLLSIKINYIGGLRLTRCPECGTIMCSKCNVGGKDVCAVCKLMKADSEIFKRGEKEIYDRKKESFFKRQMLFTHIFTFLTPGGGLIFLNKTAEGTFSLFFTVCILVFYCFNNWSPVIYFKSGFAATFLVVSVLLLIYFVSIVRTLFVLRGN